MARTPQDVTDAELAVLDVIWKNGPAAIRRITDDLYPGGGAAHYATVQKLLERLEAKGFVARRRGEAVHLFSARVDRDALIGRRLQSTAEKLCGGSMTPILMHLVRHRKLNLRERQELRALIEELADDKRPREK